MAHATPEKAKIQALEGLRGLMAWWVVLGHVSLAFGWKLGLVDKNGLAVDVFILLSGFVIARLIDLKAEPYGGYITRRAFRLFPLYLVALGISAILLPMQLAAWESLPATPLNANRIMLVREAMANLPAHLAVHIPLAHGLIPFRILPYAAYTIIGQSWSISLEWQFYLVAPLIAVLLGRARYLPLLAAVTLALAFVAGHFSEAFLGAKLAWFLLGMACWRLFERRTAYYGMIGALLAGYILVRGGALQLVPLAIWTIVLASAASGGRIAGVLGSRVVVHQGEISYSIYMLHVFPLYGSSWILSMAGLAGPLLGLSVLAITVAATYLLSRLTHRYVEKPGQDWGARLTKNPLIWRRALRVDIKARDP